ncbi:MAG: hypothetical protein HY270_20415 [Deltaproteobacteria bacterium]|nr:hypothetical protein [Deltaproteobacteria bacterium]
MIGAEERSPRALPGVAAWAALAVLLVSALAWRLPAIPADWRFTLCENDSLYQLHRIEDCLRHYPQVQSVDPYSHYPGGYRVPWMPLHTVFYSSLAKLAGVSGDERERLVALLSWVPPLAGLVAMVLALAIARTYTNDPFCLLLIGFLCAFESDVVRVFIFGTIDHHLFAHVGLLAMVWSRLHRRLGGWVLGSLSLLAMTPESIVYVSALLGCVFLAETAAATALAPRDLRPLWPWYLAPAAVSVITWWVNHNLEARPLPIGNLTWMYPTLFAPLWFSVLAGSMTAATAWFDHRPASLSRVAAACAFVGAAAVALLAATGSLQMIAQRLAGGGGRLFVAEEASVFAHGFWSAAAWYRILVLAAIYVAVELIRGVDTKRDSREWFQWLVLAVAFALGFKEYRHAYILSSLQMIGLALAMFATTAALRKLPMFSSGLRAMPALLAAALVLPFFVSRNLMDRSDATGHLCAGLPLLEETAAWLKHNTPDPTGGDGPAYGVFANWSAGHQLHILGERPVVLDPLNYGLDRWVEQALWRTWHARKSDALAQALTQYRAAYLVLTNPTFEVLDTLGPDDPPRHDLVEDGPNGTVTFKPAMSQYSVFRLFMSGGMSPEFGQLQLRHLSSDAEHYTTSVGGEERAVVIPRVQIFELKQGARVTGQAPDGVKAVQVEYRLWRAGTSEAETIQMSLPVGAEHQFELHTSLPAPDREQSFSIETGYTFKAGEFSRSAVVTQEMVDRGTVIRLDLVAAPPPI